MREVRILGTNFPPNMELNRPPNRSLNPQSISGSETNIDQNPSSSQNITAAATNSRHHPFLMTCDMRISNGNNRPIFTTVGLWDTGSQTSYITQSLVDKLKLPKVLTFNHAVSLFGAKTVKFRSTGYNVRLHKPNGKWEETVLSSIPQIIPSLPCIDWDGIDPPFDQLDLNKLKVADKEPEILLGIKDFWRFFLESKKIGSNLHLIKTHFGSMLCGELPNRSPKKNKFRQTALPTISLISIKSSPPKRDPVTSSVKPKAFIKEKTGFPRMSEISKPKTINQSFSSNKSRGPRVFINPKMDKRKQPRIVNKNYFPAESPIIKIAQPGYFKNNERHSLSPTQNHYVLNRSQERFTRHTVPPRVFNSQKFLTEPPSWIYSNDQPYCHRTQLKQLKNLESSQSKSTTAMVMGHKVNAAKCLGTNKWHEWNPGRAPQCRQWRVCYWR